MAAAYVQKLVVSTPDTTGTFASVSTSGNAILVWIGWDGAQAETGSATDSKGNTYTVLTHHNWQGTTSRTALLLAKNITGGGAAIEITFSVTGSPGNIWNQKAVEFGGVSTDPLDDFRIANGSSDSPSSGAYTTAAGAVILWGAHDETGGTFTDTTSFTDRGDNLFTKAVASSSSQSFGGGLGGTFAWNAWVVGLKEPAAAATPKFLTLLGAGQ